MKKVAIYTRVSTLEQKESGYSLGEQKSRLEAYCKSRDWEIYKTYEDGGYSGSNILRPAMDEMLDAVGQKKFDAVLVYKLDRLSRSQKDTLYIIEDVLLKNGVEFVSINENFDTSTPFGRAVIGLLAAFAQLERELITERFAMGRLARAKSGKWHGGGNYDPFGYSYEDNTLTIIESEAVVIQDIFKTYVDGNSLRMTARKINKKYPEYNVTKSKVEKILDQRMYIGKIKFANEYHPGQQKAIVDEDTFYTAQKIKGDRSRGEGFTNKRKGLLLGKLYCGKCGARYYRKVSSRNQNGKRYVYNYYECTSRSKSYTQRAYATAEDCDNKIWREEELDNLIIDKLKKLNFDNFELDEEKTNTNNTKKRIKKIKKQLKRLSDLYFNEVIEEDEMIVRSTDLKDSLYYLEELLEEPEETSGKEKADNLKHFDWKKEPKEKQMKLIDEIVYRIKLDNDAVDITLDF